MKQIHILIAALLLCSVAAASMEDIRPYSLVIIAWDEDGSRAVDMPVTFTYGSQSDTLYTADDGSVVFSLLNFDDVSDGDYIDISCTYGVQRVQVDYEAGEKGATFNEPSEKIAMDAFAAMGVVVVVALGGGRYLLRRKKNIVNKGDTMDENEPTDETTGSKLIRDFGVRALIATVAILGYIGISGIAVYHGDMSMLEDISKIFMPIMMAIIVFYFNGSAIRDVSK